jgi:hypothetical protein
VTVIGGRPGQRGKLGRDLWPERVIEIGARSPIDKADAELPRRLCRAVEFARIDAEPSVDITGKKAGGAFTDADNPKLFRPKDANIELERMDLQGDCSDEAGAATTEDDDFFALCSAARRLSFSLRPT